MTHSTTKIIADATQNQHTAADPNASVWLSAHAGTGKTHVLVQRIIRLLIQDDALLPRHILALTFSRAAAEEMRTRLTQKVTSWQHLSTTELTDILHPILGRAPTKPELISAQHIPARLVAAPLNAQTLHGFCQNILKRFPLEAGINPAFTLWEEKQQLTGLKTARDIALHALQNVAHPSFWAFEWLAGQLGDAAIQEGADVYVNKRDKLKPLALDAHFKDRLADALHLPVHTTPQHLHPIQQTLHYIQKQCPILNTGGANAQKFVQNFNAHTAQDSSTWQALLFNPDGSPKKWGTLITKKIAPLIPQDFIPTLEAEQHRLLAVKTYLNTTAFMAIGIATEEAYHTLKTTASALDFSDLITTVATLFKNPTTADWVRYKLDGGISHILLDETQDTNPTQWAVVEALLSDFFNVDSPSKHPRTVFTVGDFKQSIYRFQGAASDVFAAMKTPLIAAAENGFKTHTNTTLSTSFRSTPPLLKAVDHVFNQPHIADITSIAGQDIHHTTARQNEAGRVEIWPPQPAPEKTEPEPWTLPNLRKKSPSAPSLLMQKIAQKLQVIFNEERITVRQNGRPISTRPAAPQDVLLLVRSKSILPELTAALQAVRIPFSTTLKGQDTLKHPIAEDIFTLLQFLSQPEADAPLLSVLRSPLFGYSNPDISALLHARQEEEPLWHTLHKTPNAPALTTLQNALTYAQQHTPYALLVWLNHTLHLTQKLALNMGVGEHATHVSQQQFQAFLSAAESHDSLPLFLQEITDHGLTVHASNSHSGVRILTAHGAKGLQAPIVFLVDAGRAMFGKQKDETLVWDNEICLYRSAKNQATHLQQKSDREEKNRILQDELRLLYVAMTRAEEQLYICAVGDPEKLQKSDPDTHTPSSWWGLLAQTAQAENWATTTENHWYLHDVGTPLPQQDDAPLIPPQNTDLPPWLTTHTPYTPTPIKTPSPEQQRGTLIHKALEHITAKNTAAATHILPPEDAALIQKLVQKFPHFFTPHNQTEVPLIINGQKRLIDRLIIDKDAITIIDYKTGEQPPTAPQNYRKQLTLYRTAVQQLYPNHSISMGILWLDTQTWEVL